jgi:fatty acid-binding protein DegV
MVRPDGTLGVTARTRGGRKKALQFLLDDFRENLTQMSLERVFITHSGCQPDAEYLKSEVLKLAPVEQICIATAGSVIASHCGPGTIGIMYMLN